MSNEAIRTLYASEPGRYVAIFRDPPLNEWAPSIVLSYRIQIREVEGQVCTFDSSVLTTQSPREWVPFSTGKHTRLAEVEAEIEAGYLVPQEG